MTKQWSRTDADLRELDERVDFHVTVGRCDNPLIGPLFYGSSWACWFWVPVAPALTYSDGTKTVEPEAKAAIPDA